MHIPSENMLQLFVVDTLLSMEMQLIPIIPYLRLNTRMRIATPAKILVRMFPTGIREYS